MPTFHGRSPKHACDEFDLLLVSSPYGNLDCLTQQVEEGFRAHELPIDGFLLHRLHLPLPLLGESRKSPLHKHLRPIKTRLAEYAPQNQHLVRRYVQEAKQQTLSKFLGVGLLSPHSEPAKSLATAFDPQSFRFTP